MKITINENVLNNTYIVNVYDGPNGIDHAEFICKSLGEAFEEIMRFRAFNAMSYADDPKESLKHYFSSINYD